MAAMAAMAGLAIGGAVVQAESQKSQAKYQRTMYDINARNADIQAQDAIERGNVDAATARRGAKQFQASQRADIAASGQTGSAMETAILSETGQLGEMDVMQIKNNAWREAWGYRAQAEESRQQGQMALLQGKAAARNTLLVGGMQSMSYMAGGVKGGGAKKPTGTNSSRSYTTTSTGKDAQGYA
jgi:hypothetical protein